MVIQTRPFIVKLNDTEKGLNFCENLKYEGVLSDQ